MHTTTYTLLIFKYNKNKIIIFNYFYFIINHLKNVNDLCKRLWYWKEYNGKLYLLNI